MIKLINMDQQDNINHWSFESQNGFKRVIYKLGNRPFYMPMGHSMSLPKEFENLDLYPKLCEIVVNAKGNKIIKPTKKVQFDDTLVFASFNYSTADMNLVEINHGFETVEKKRLISNGKVYRNIILKAKIPTAMYFVVKAHELLVFTWNGVYVIEKSCYFDKIKNLDESKRVNVFRDTFVQELKAQLFKKSFSFEDIRKTSEKSFVKALH